MLCITRRCFLEKEPSENPATQKESAIVDCCGRPRIRSGIWPKTNMEVKRHEELTGHTSQCQAASSRLFGVGLKEPWAPRMHVPQDKDRAGGAPGIALRENSTSLEGEGCNERRMNDCQEAPAGSEWPLPLSRICAAGTRRLSDSHLHYAPLRTPTFARDRGVYQRPCPERWLHSRPAPRRRGLPVTTGFPGGRQRRACRGRSRLRKWAEGWRPSRGAGAARNPRLRRGPVLPAQRRPRPQPRPQSATRGGLRAPGWGDGERGRVRHHEGENGGRAGPRAAAVLTRAGQCG